MVGRGRLSAVFLGVGLACTGHDGSDRGVEPTDRPSEGAQEGEGNEQAGPVIVTLETREHVISIHVDGAQGREFSIVAPDGRVLASRITAVELRRDFPGLYEAIESSVADLDCSGRDCAVLDASARSVVDAGL